MTDRDETEKTKVDKFRDVIGILERNLKYLRSAGLDSSTASAYRKALTFLKRRSEPEVEAILSGRRHRTLAYQQDNESLMTANEISQLSTEDVAKLIDSTLPTDFLEQLAVVRFGMTHGSLSTLRNRSALIDKIKTSLNHEITHDAISRAISSSGPNDVGR